MTIRSMPNTDAYRKGHERIFGTGPRPPKPKPCPTCGKRPCDPNHVHAIVMPPVTCVPCNEEHPRGEPCPKCGRSLLLG
jgi:hypothetical protein